MEAKKTKNSLIELAINFKHGFRFLEHSCFTNLLDIPKGKFSRWPWFYQGNLPALGPFGYCPSSSKVVKKVPTFRFTTPFKGNLPNSGTKPFLTFPGPIPRNPLPFRKLTIPVFTWVVKGRWRKLQSQPSNVLDN